jgi:hypothetical protein
VKYIWKHKRPQTAKAFLSKKSNTGGITILDLKLYYRAITTKTVRKPVDQNRSPHIYSQLIFDKGAQNT